jgi:hypothetical protein
LFGCIRLAEVDAPERTQPYSQVSSKDLDSLCRDKPVSIEKIDVDRYGRTVAHVRCAIKPRSASDLYARLHMPNFAARLRHARTAKVDTVAPVAPFRPR